jgi:hypothetical protein
VASPRVGIYGDSGALGLGFHSGVYTNDPNRHLDKVSGSTPLGCGVIVTHDWCVSAAQWGQIAASNGTQIALIYSGSWEVKCLQPKDETWPECHALGEPIFDAYIRRHLTERSSALLNAGVARVVYVKQEYGPGATAEQLSNQARWNRWYQLLDEHAATDARISVIDIRPYFHGLANQQAIRYDGYHYTEQSWMVWRDYLEAALYWNLWVPANS